MTNNMTAFYAFALSFALRAVFVCCHDQYTKEEVQTIADAIGEYERKGGE